MTYHFFDYKHNISGFQSDLFSAPHLVYVGIVFLFSFMLWPPGFSGTRAGRGSGNG